MEPDVDRDRRALIDRLFASSVAVGAMLNAEDSVARPRGGESGWYDVKSDFRAAGNGVADDTDNFVAAIKAGSAEHRPIVVPPGSYKLTRALQIPANTILVGSNCASGFGCRLEPHGCAAFEIGGAQSSFACLIQDLMIWPKDEPAEHVLRIDNSYSIVIRNLRVHEVQAGPGVAALLLLGNKSSGGHGPCSNIVWDNVIVRNDVAQPARSAVLARPGCGTHKFFVPDLENYLDLFTWQGGGIDMFVPHAERAGRYAFDCRSVDPGDDGAFFNVYGGTVAAAPSGIACALGTKTGPFNSFGTSWRSPRPKGASHAVYVYGVPDSPATFHGTTPILDSARESSWAGVAGWERAIELPDYVIKGAFKDWDVRVPALGRESRELKLEGVRPGRHWVQAHLDGDPSTLQVSAYVSKPDTITVIAQNLATTAASVKNATLLLKAGWL